MNEIQGLGIQQLWQMSTLKGGLRQRTNPTKTQNGKRGNLEVLTSLRRKWHGDPRFHNVLELNI